MSVNDRAMPMWIMHSLWAPTSTNLAQFSGLIACFVYFYVDDVHFSTRNWTTTLHHQIMSFLSKWNAIGKKEEGEGEEDGEKKMKTVERYRISKRTIQIGLMISNGIDSKYPLEMAKKRDRDCERENEEQNTAIYLIRSKKNSLKSRARPNCSVLRFFIRAEIVTIFWLWSGTW